MMKAPSGYISRPLVEDIPSRYETVAEFLSRGGVVDKCPSRTATGVATSTIYVDGQSLPIRGNLAPDIEVPYKLTVDDYDAAQRRVAEDGTDDGTTADWRQYEQLGTHMQQADAIIQSRLDHSMDGE